VKYIPFSPPDITEMEISEVVEAMKSGWINDRTADEAFRTKIAEYCGTSKGGPA
jgi:dTDP-4-amino-4,6-dideoxygalactose transaminase